MTDVETIARTLYAEAAHRPVRAIEALAALAVNRARAALPRPVRIAGAAPFAPGGHARLPEPGAREVAAAARDPFAFPCRNPRHPAHARLEGPGADPGMAICRRVAARAASSALPDLTGGATHWHDIATLPAWAVGQAATAEIGGLVFYRPDAAAPPLPAARPALVAVA
ncbi:cell wall hydrolase [Roseomonas sp. CCTCC AB2023176]|uniref:cell wall hydrolase n=1 Tax=Roseomonas sp. CCTCC AB2023176 TaxID=3342640 RepID=UPI0035E0F35E